MMHVSRGKVQETAMPSIKANKQQATEDLEDNVRANIIITQLTTVLLIASPQAQAS